MAGGVMTDRLVTIATFRDVAQAHIARSALEAAGIKAALTEEEGSSLFGSTPAVGGVHLLVREEDGEGAGRVLDETFDPRQMDEEELAAQAEAAGTQEEPEVQAPPETVRDRENDAGNALLCSLIGFFIPLVLMWTAILILRASSGPGRLSRRGRLYLVIAGSIVASWFILFMTALAMLRAE